jgi:hypothetical protein
MDRRAVMIEVRVVTVKIRTKFTERGLLLQHRHEIALVAALLQHLPQRGFVFLGGLPFLLQVGDDLFRPGRADAFPGQLFYRLHCGELLQFLLLRHG